MRRQYLPAIATPVPCQDGVDLRASRSACILLSDGPQASWWNPRTRNLGMQPQYAWTLKQNNGRACALIGCLEHRITQDQPVRARDMAR